MTYRLHAQSQKDAVSVPLWAAAITFIAAVLLVIALICGSRVGTALGTMANVSLSLFVLLPAAALGTLILWPARKNLLQLNTPLPGVYFLLIAGGVGLGALALLTLAVGSLHWLSMAPLIVLAGSAVAGYPTLSSHIRSLNFKAVRQSIHPKWLIAAAAVAVPIGVLLVAACFPAGTLWHTEGNGYDVLEYHLQLPRQFIAAGNTNPVPGNIYSFLPLNIEMIFTLIGGLVRILPGWAGIYSLVYGSQLLMVCVTVLAAGAVGLAPLRLSWRARAIATLLFLSTPWVIVIGSLAYNDPAVLYLGALAIPLALGCKQRPCFWIIGLIVGLAVGVKMTAGVSVALPVAAILISTRCWRGVLMVVLVATAAYTPWMLRSMVASHTPTSIGNPIFPLFAHTLGMNHWSNSLAARFDRGHTAPTRDAGVIGHLHALADQWLLNRQFGAGVAAVAAATAHHPGYPGPKTPWVLRFGLIWLVWLPAVGISLAAGSEAWLLAVVACVQILSWLLFTQLQARFLVPLILPTAWMAAMAIGPIPRVSAALTAALAFQLAFLMVFLRSENGTFLGGPYSRVMGRIFELPQMWLATPEPNNVFAPLGLSDPQARIYLEGFDAPLYVRGHLIYNTVFNRNRLAREFAAHGAADTVAWLQRHHVRLVIFDWAEIQRLRHTYGFNKVVTPRMQQRLLAAGLLPLPARLAPNISMLIVPEPTNP